MFSSHINRWNREFVFYLDTGTFLLLKKQKEEEHFVTVNFSHCSYITIAPDLLLTIFTIKLIHTVHSGI